MKRYGQVFALALFVGTLELGGGYWCGSLALIADAFHATLDGGAGGLSLFIAWLVRGRDESGERRARAWGALGQGLFLAAAAVWVATETYDRWQTPHEVRGGIMMAVAALGGAVNYGQHRLLACVGTQNQTHANLHRHVRSDLVLSGCVVLGGFAISITGLRWIDLALSFGAAVYIGVQAARILHEVALPRA